MKSFAKFGSRGAALAAALMAGGMAVQSGHAQLLLNEANATSATNYVDLDFGKPYEGYDYGVIPHSGSPANAFVSDIDAGTSGNQTTLPNGWDGTTGWGRILGNGGDWMEFVVTTDGLDMRGWTIYWENDDDQNGSVGSNPDERGVIRISNDPIWNNLRAGTIITMIESEDNITTIDEVTDAWPNGSPGTGTADTGYDYDLSTDVSFDPVGSGTPTAPGADADWHLHFSVDEETTQALNQDTQYFLAGSNIKVDNDKWQTLFFDSSNTTIAADAEDGTKVRGDLDLTTGAIGELIGESALSFGSSKFGLNTGAGGVNNQEVITLVANVTPGLGDSNVNADFEDVDFSTFGTENLFNANTEDTLDGVQDFSVLRGWLSSILPGDANLDGTVDVLDLSILATGYGGTNTWKGGDFNADQDVDVLDLSILATNYGQSSSATAVPEPASLVLLGLAGLALFARRR